MLTVYILRQILWADTFQTSPPGSSTNLLLGNPCRCNTHGLHTHRANLATLKDWNGLTKREHGVICISQAQGWHMGFADAAPLPTVPGQAGAVWQKVGLGPPTAAPPPPPPSPETQCAAT